MPWGVGDVLRAFFVDVFNVSCAEVPRGVTCLVVVESFVSLVIVTAEDVGKVRIVEFVVAFSFRLVEISFLVLSALHSTAEQGHILVIFAEDTAVNPTEKGKHLLKPFFNSVSCISFFFRENLICNLERVFLKLDSISFSTFLLKT